MEHPTEEKKLPSRHIASIFQEYTKPSRLLRSFTNLSNTVIQTALSGQSKFVFEILQNADDAFEDKDKTIEVQFVLHGNYLIVHHNGKGFNFNDVERICDYASQIEEVKETDLRKTGFKGIGFKSLFNLSDCIYIYSNGYSFRFDKTHWADSHTKPWQVIPIWCRYDELPLHDEYSYNQPVNFILKVNVVNQIESQLRELVNQTDLLLYMYRISKLIVNLNGETYSLEREVVKFESFNKVNFYKNQALASSWLSKTYNRAVPKEVQKFVRGASRFIYPEKIQKARSVPFTFSLRINETVQEVAAVNGLCYCTLPTQLHLSLPYHINSFFILNLDRTQLHENEWNEFLLYEMGLLQFHLLKDLAVLPYVRNYVIELYIREIDHPYITFKKAFLKGFNEAKYEIAWLPAHHGSRLLKLGEAWIDDTEFFKQNFRKIRDHKIFPFLISYDVRNVYDLYTIEGEVKQFMFEDLFKVFLEKYYPQLTKDGYIKFISFLYEKLKNFRPNHTVISKLKKLPFLIAKDGTLQSPKEALIEESNNPIPDFSMLNPIDNEYLPLNNSTLIKDWIKLLGARQLLTPIEILRESILLWMDSGDFEFNISMNNHIEIMSYLAKNADQLTKKETEKLREKLLILTEANQFQLAKLCYFPDAIYVAELRDIISNEEKVSSSYDMNSLREFFILVGVHDEIDPINVFRKGILSWISNGEISFKLEIRNYKPIIEFLASHYLIIENKLSDSEKKDLRKMPVLTCSENFQRAQNCFFDSAIPNIKGLEYVVARNKLVSSSDMPDSVYTFLSKIGVSKEMAPIDIIRRSILKWIQEDIITNRITLDNHHSILEYIAVQWFTSSLAGLKPEEINYLKEIPVLTEKKTFRSACNCFWTPSASDSYHEEIPGLECIISADEFVSSSYQLKEIKVLLEDLGVHNLGFTDIYEKYCDHLKQYENVKWFFSQLKTYWNHNKANAKKDKLLRYLPWKLKLSSCLLAKNHKVYSSTQLYSSRFDIMHDIDSNAVPLLDYEKLPEDLEEWLGFNTELDLECISQLLEAIRKKPKIGERETVAFFTKLLEQLKQKDRNEIRKYNLSLFSQEFKLKPAKDLYYFKEEDATCVLRSCYLKRINGMSHKDTLELAELCGVNILPFEQRVERENEVYDNNLKEFYLERLPLIVVQESLELNESPSIILKRLYDEICSIQLYQCQRIYVHYPFGVPVEIDRHFCNLTLYVVGKWSTWLFRSDIHIYIKKQLSCKTDIGKIMDMLQITEEDKHQWLNYMQEDPKKLYLIEEELRKLWPALKKVNTVTSIKDEKIDQSPLDSEEDESDLSESEGLSFSESPSTDESRRRRPYKNSSDSDDSALHLKPVSALNLEVSRAHGTLFDASEKVASNEIPAVIDAPVLSLEQKFEPVRQDCINAGPVSNRMDMIKVDLNFPILYPPAINNEEIIKQQEKIYNQYSFTENLFGDYCLVNNILCEKPIRKWFSERYVYNFLQDHYKNKYPNSVPELSDDVFLLQCQSHKIEIKWLNKRKDKGLVYDILLKKDGKIKWLIKVKSVVQESNYLFSMCHYKFRQKVNQIALDMPLYKEKYCVYCVLMEDISSMENISALYKLEPLKNR